MLERVAAVRRPARAQRYVTDHLTLGVLSARSRARVRALVAHARSVRRAVRVHDALGPAVLVRVARVLGQARARAGAILFATHGVRAARTWHARIDVFHGNGSWKIISQLESVVFTLLYW